VGTSGAFVPPLFELPHALIEPSCVSTAKANNDYTKIYSSEYAFAALKADGSIKVWGEANAGGANAPDGTGYTDIYSNTYAFAALKADGSIKTWGDSDSGGANAPDGSGYTKIYSNAFAFAVLTHDGSIKAWGNSKSGGTNAPDVPTDKGYIKIYSTYSQTLIDPSALRAAKAYSLE
jgi:hypothetical protein